MAHAERLLALAECPHPHCWHGTGMRKLRGRIVMCCHCRIEGVEESDAKVRPKRGAHGPYTPRRVQQESEQCTRGHGAIGQCVRNGDCLCRLDRERAAHQRPTERESEVE